MKLETIVHSQTVNNVHCCKIKSGRIGVWYSNIVCGQTVNGVHDHKIKQPVELGGSGIQNTLQ
jgi:hypothetical protein